MKTSKTEARVAPIDLRLRLWSDEIALAPFLHRLGTRDIVHVRGEPIPSRRGTTERTAPRHYASISHKRAGNVGAVGAWVRASLDWICADQVLKSRIETHQIEATFWIAILGKQRLPTPKLDISLVAEAASLGMTIFLENFTDLQDGNPSRRWLPEKPAVSAHADRAYPT